MVTWSSPNTYIKQYNHVHAVCFLTFKIGTEILKKWAFKCSGLA